MNWTVLRRSPYVCCFDKPDSRLVVTGFCFRAGSGFLRPFAANCNYSTKLSVASFALSVKIEDSLFIIAIDLDSRISFYAKDLPPSLPLITLSNVSPDVEAVGGAIGADGLTGLGLYCKG